jgi:surface antigen
VSDELTPDPLAELLANPDANQSVPVPLVPTTPQFSSRREIRDAAGKNSAKAPARKIGTGKSVAAANASAAYQGPKSQRVKLSMKDRALARRLAVTPRAAATPPRRSGAKARQNPLKMMFVLLVISGFVGGIALPAAALGANNGGQAQSYQTTAEGKQAFKSTATIEIPAVTRDEISATSEAELRAEQVSSAKLVSNLASNLASYPGARQPGDDYPWPSAGNTLSPLGYYYRQCVDFVAWRLNRDAGVTSAPWKWTWSNLTPNGGDASQWKAAWEAHGWKTSATPVVGSVAWFVGNHVAYVNAIKGSSVVIEEYNGSASRTYAMRTIPIDSVGRFLYPPP